jgi:hypothetical protein
MENRYIMVDRAAGVVVAMVLLVIGLMLIVLGCTFLPMIGILAALPVMAISLQFLTLKPEFRVQAEEESVGEPAMACIEYESWCPWPQSAVSQEAA